jgi:universal stress protein E
MKILVIWGMETKAPGLLARVRSLAPVESARVTIAVLFNKTSREAWGISNPCEFMADIRAQAAAVFGDTVPVTVESDDTDDIADWALGKVSEGAFDLVVKTGHRTESFLHTPSDWTLMRGLKVPFCITSPMKLKSRPIILAAVDLDPALDEAAMTDAVLSQAAKLARAQDAALEVVHVLAVNRALAEIDAVDPETVLYQKGPAAREKLDQLLADRSVQASASHILAGSPGLVVAKLARKRKADLVVMGSAGRTGLRAALLGNTAEKCVHELKTDLMVVKA